MPGSLIPFLEIQTYVHDVLESPKSAIGEKLTHFAILMVARQWTQQVIWSLHEANAIKSGLKSEIVSALAAGRRPPAMSDDEAILYDFCIELQQNQSVSDADLCANAEAIRGEGDRGGDAVCRASTQSCRCS